ncbi:uncharacterized protein [Battus philenor]|uniref:uncharacterized protein n=1 Tax=Battus philenor TaxID=42288 RepID=UPI0035D0F3DB
MVGLLIAYQLYSDIAPLTCENFLRLCKEKRGGYSGTPVHRIVKDGWIQCGGYGLKTTPLDCENFIVPPDRRGVLCMANDGRHTDCSTQFFVLLQPAPWMEKKYVAFGQLVDGERTLQRIENVPTFYESPTSEIIIFEAGILNLHCQDLVVNRGTFEYIYNHIENLKEVAEILKDLMYENLWAELTARELARIQEEEEESRGERDRRNVRATKRFIRKKEDLDKQFKASTMTAEVDIESAIDEDYYVEGYESSYDYETEESVPLLSPPPEEVPKPDRWVYFPLTDVPYPGEVDSTHDLKKFIKGHYCLETDLVQKPPEPDVKHDHTVQYQKMSYPSEIFQFDQSFESEDISVSSLDSNEEKEIRRYIKLNVDRISFAGDVIKSIARGSSKLNLFEDARKSELITDEDLRKLRIASVDHRSKERTRFSSMTRAKDDKKVSIIAPDLPKSHEKIKRRPTGFPRPETLEKILKSKDSISLEDEEPIEPRKVSIVAPEVLKPHEKIRRRPTGFPRPETLENIIKSKESEEDEELLEPSAVQSIDSRKVRIAPNVRSVQGAIGRRTVSEQYSGDSDLEVRRQSVLTRLLNDLTTVDESGPTLKDYRPLSELKQGNPLLTFTAYLARKSEDNTQKYVRPSLKMETPSIDRVMNIQHGKKMVRKVSSDYVKTIGQIEEEFENSIRSIEFAKKRPSLSISQYQKKNQLLHEKASEKETKKGFHCTRALHELEPPLFRNHRSCVHQAHRFTKSILTGFALRKPRDTGAILFDIAKITAPPGTQAYASRRPEHRLPFRSSYSLKGFGEIPRGNVPQNTRHTTPAANLTAPSSTTAPATLHTGR